MFGEFVSHVQIHVIGKWILIELIISAIDFEQCLGVGIISGKANAQFLIDRRIISQGNRCQPDTKFISGIVRVVQGFHSQNTG